MTPEQAEHAIAALDTMLVVALVVGVLLVAVAGLATVKLLR